MSLSTKSCYLTTKPNEYNVKEKIKRSLSMKVVHRKNKDEKEKEGKVKTGENIK